MTIHETIEALDAGPIAAQEAFPVGDLDAGGVFERSAELAARLLDAGSSSRRRFGRSRTTARPTPRRSRPPTAS